MELHGPITGSLNTLAHRGTLTRFLAAERAERNLLGLGQQFEREAKNRAAQNLS